MVPDTPIGQPAISKPREDILMINSLFRTSNSIFVVWLILAASAAAAPARAEDIGQEIESLNATWVRMFKDKDVTGIAALYAPDGVLLPPNAEAVEGRAAIAEFWTAMSKLPNVELGFAAKRIEAAESDDLAYDYGTYTLAFDVDQGRVVDNGKYIVVWKKVDDGWMVAADIFNSNVAK
jgi:uncharacterized protein (TIGR02246 family)